MVTNKNILSLLTIDFGKKWYESECSSNFKPDSTNTLELYLDNGWQFSFRIHNASTKVEPSLKFDIQIIGMPTTIITVNSFWVN